MNARPSPQPAAMPGWFVAHDALGEGALEAVVCLPTYRRPEMLARALASLLGQQTSRSYGLVVVDNDGAGRAGEAAARAVLEPAGRPFALLVEPRQGNCKAYNAAWSFVRQRLPDCPFLLGIDDDEEAMPGWLEALVATAESSGAEIVGGPVTPVFSHPRFEPLRRHPVFRSHYSASGPVPQLYSSANYLIRAATLDAMGRPWLDERFDFTGGGDTDFFTRARLRGVRFHWSQEAMLTETMPPRRTEPDWIRARSYRNGMISALIARKADPSPMGRARTLAKSLALLAASPFRGLRDGISARSLTVGLYHAQVALGRLGAEFGLSIEQYRAPEKN